MRAINVLDVIMTTMSSNSQNVPAAASLQPEAAGVGMRLKKVVPASVALSASSVPAGTGKGGGSAAAVLEDRSDGADLVCGGILRTVRGTFLNPESR